MVGLAKNVEPGRKPSGDISDMYCTISGEVPQHPVISRLSGHLFEKRLIERSLEASNGICPATGVELKLSDLIAAAYRRFDLFLRELSKFASI